MGVGQLQGMISVSSVKDTELISLKVANNDPQFAVDVVNNLATEFRNNIMNIYKTDNVTVWDKATLQDTPKVGPKVSRNTLIGVLLCLILSLGYITLRFLFDRTLRTEEQLKSTFDYPILGILPNKFTDDEKNLEIVTSAYNESLSLLRTNISFSSINDAMKVIMITSSQPNEGKSTMVTDLARSIAKTGKKVLLLDGDLRNPTLNLKTDVKNNYGIVNYLVKNTNLEDIIVRDTQAESLDVVSTGPNPPNPAELLGSKKMRDFIEIVKPYYDYILIDSSPASLFSDARLLSSYADGTILIAAQGEANIDRLKQTVDSLKQVGAHILGLVMTKIDFKDPMHTSYGYGYGYGYGYAKEEHENHKRKRISTRRKTNK